MTCLVKLVDFTQGIFKRDRILVSIWKVKIECADLVGIQGFERLVEYCSKLSWAKTARLPRIYPVEPEIKLKGYELGANGTGLVLRINGRSFKVKFSQKLSCPTFKIKQRIKPKVVVANLFRAPVSVKSRSVKCFVSVTHDDIHNFLSLGKGMDSRGIRIRLAEHSSTLCKQWFD
jgi:hypothetical protein